MQIDSETQSTGIKNISEMSKNEIKEIFYDAIESSEFYEQQIEFDDFVKFIEKNDNITYDNWVTIINNIRKYRKDSEYFLQLLNFIVLSESEKNKIYKLLYEYSTNIPLLKYFKSNETNLNFSYEELNENIKQVKKRFHCEVENEDTLTIYGEGKITENILKEYKNMEIKTVTFDESVKSIEVVARPMDEGPFSLLKNLTNIIIPNSVTSIGDYAFKGCSLLKSINIPNSVKSIGHSAFGGCSSLTSIIIPNRVTSIGESAFSGCSSLTNINIPNGVTKIGKGAFNVCSLLTNITISNSVTSIGKWAFYGCSSLTNITIPNSVTEIEKGAFASCSSLTNITIPDSVTSIGGWAFQNCSSITTIDIPNGVTKIGKCAFENCISLTSITIPDSVTEIEEGAFDGCSKLTNITIQNSVTSIGNQAFYGCSKLTNIMEKLQSITNAKIKVQKNESQVSSDVPPQGEQNKQNCLQQTH